MIPCRFEAFGLDATFEGVFPFKQVDGHVTQDAEIFRRMVFAYPAVVFSESDVQAPVQAVFDTPVFSDGFGDGGGVVFEAGDEVRCFRRDLRVNIPLSDSHGDGFNTGPQVFSRKPVDIAGGKILSGFDTTVVSIDGFERLEGAIGRVLEEQGDVFVEPLLVVFDLEDVIGLFFDDGVGDFFLTAHGIDGDNGAFQGKGFDQFRDGGNLIGFVVGFELAQHQSDL